jgi:tetratricopeptide (TPR) repeat protein
MSEQGTGETEGTLATDHTGVQASDDSWEGGRRYELGDELARGGGGRVHVATDRRLGREVAVKVPREDTGAQARLVREARLMARLEHPSIVPVHDIGRDDDGAPYYVMRLLDGQTLRARIADRPFDERIALLPTLIAVAEAVAYAHHHGVVHRDLKPSNVIVGEFGETFVIDWGLARAVGEAPDAGGAGGAGGASPDEAPAAPGVTATGAVVGTPAYMAPEQARGESVDRRVDVYGLGALLYHVLVGEPPYRGETAKEILARVLDGPPPPATEREPRIPRELGAIVAKAMARDPASRYASAQELAQDLQRYQAGRLVAAHRYTVWQRVRRRVRRHRWLLAIAGALAVAAAAIALSWPSREADAIAMCARTREAVTARWDERRRTAITERVRASGGPGAAVAAPAIAERLDRYAGRLGEARIAACEATHLRGEQSAELLDRRMQCLDRRLDQLQATVDAIASVTSAELANAVRAVDELPDAEPCGAAVLLGGFVPLPDDPATRGRVQATQQRIAAARAETELGRYPAAREALAALGRDPALELYAPLASEAHLALGTLHDDVGVLDAADRWLHEAMRDAELGDADKLRADALLELAVVANKRERHADAEVLARQVLAIATRIGDRELEAHARIAEANAATGRGDLARGIDLARRALDRWGDRPNDTVLGDLVGTLGGKLLVARRWAEAEPYIRRALELHERTFGPEHPLLITSLSNLAAVLMTTDRAEEGIAVAKRGLALLDRLGLGDGDEAMRFLSNLPVALSNLDRFDEAEAVLKQLRTRLEKKYGPEHDNVTTILYNLGNNRLLAHDAAGAEPWFRQVLERRERAFGPRHIKVASARSALGDTLLQQKKPAEALPLLVAALPVQLAETGEGSDDVAYTHVSLAMTYLELGRPAEALPHAELALPYFEKGPHVDERGQVRLYLAWALHDARRDLPRALELAKQGRADLVASGRPQADDLALAERLLRDLEAR